MYWAEKEKDRSSCYGQGGNGGEGGGLQKGAHGSNSFLPSWGQSWQGKMLERFTWGGGWGVRQGRVIGEYVAEPPKGMAWLWGQQGLKGCRWLS